MTGDAVIALALLATIWIGWPLWRIASAFDQLLRLAKSDRRD